MTENNTLLDVRDLKKHFPIVRGLVRRQVGAVKAVDGVTVDIRRGETFGLGGESGCGKSTTGRVILQLYRPTSGKVNFDGLELTEMKGEAVRRLRPRMQMIFQDPYASLNPRLTVGQLISEPLEIHLGMSSKQRTDRARELLELVGLNPKFDRRYPHEFSGGQRQRIGVARALALNPE